MASRRFEVIAGVDLVLEVECAGKREAGRIAAVAARTLFDEEAQIASGNPTGSAAAIKWPSSSREPEIRAVGRSDEDGFEVTIPAALRLVVKAQNLAAARTAGETAARRLAEGYASVACVDSRIVRALICCPGETVDPEALLLEPAGAFATPSALSVKGVGRREPRVAGRA